MEMVSTMEEEKDSCGHLMEPIQQLSMATCAGVGRGGSGKTTQTLGGEGRKRAILIQNRDRRGSVLRLSED